jgi:DNA-binding SARP family transcriptional activator
VTRRGLVSRLRRALGEDRDFIVTELAGYGEQESAYRLEASRDDIDMFGLEALYKSSQGLIRASDWEQAYGVLTKAESLWRGTPFMDVPSDFLHGEYVRYLEELHAQIREARLEAHVRLSLRTAADMVPELWRLADAYPGRENPRKLLMLALYRAGRHREALEVFRQWWDYLRDDIGAEPGPAIRSVSERIIRQDEVLLAESLGSDVLP